MGPLLFYRHRVVLLLRGEDPPVQARLGLQPPLLLGFARNVVQRVTFARTYGHLQHLRRSTSDTGERCSKKKRPKRVSVHFLHDNTRPHVAGESSSFYP